ncbi:MAG: flagellar biosynthesis protein FlhB [SAR86 cluster bacterium]|uniref:Flagellar biosynthetic protein FlhB n=1 Tax=SAR86 cluster bacterium TaxID=2030880 RepID=A0A2A5B6L4_9GAMM|nr:MAG: flagellar biosynthesis protein FlhB [SAR86 cluster bacterium]
MAENSTQERTEEATPKRKEDARKKGQIPRSKELNTLTSLLAAGLGLSVFGKGIVNGIKELLIDSLTFGHEAAFSRSIISVQAFDAITQFALLIGPLLILMFFVSLLSPISLGGWIFNPSLLAPKMERINIMKGFGKMFSSKSLLELFKAIGKFLLVASVTVFVISMVLDDIFGLSLQPLESALSSAGSLFIWCFFGFSSVLILVVFMDVPYQLWDFKRQIKMTKQEIKDEMKETDGKPEVKSAIRERQQEFARQRMMTEVPTADVVITNPTHFSVALRYDKSGTGAPKVVAKGRDLVAARIREIAKENGVVLFSAPPLARALYSSTDLNQEIPSNLFMAVAQVLAYVFQLQQIGSNFKSKPKRPEDLQIPDEYRNNNIMGAGV